MTVTLTYPKFFCLFYITSELFFKPKYEYSSVFLHQILTSFPHPERPAGLPVANITVPKRLWHAHFLSHCKVVSCETRQPERSIVSHASLSGRELDNAPNSWSAQRFKVRGEAESGPAALRRFCLLKSRLTSLSWMEQVVTVVQEEGVPLRWAVVERPRTLLRWRRQSPIDQAGMLFWSNVAVEFE